MKKIRKILLPILLLWGIGHIITNYILIWNVFDEIYYSRYGIKLFRPNYASYEYMSQWNPMSRDAESWYSSEGIFSNYYAEGYLEDNSYISLSMGKDGKWLEILLSVKYADHQECYLYNYTVAKKRLIFSAWQYIDDSGHTRTLSSIDEEKKQYLYDRFLTDWFEANEGRSRFSLEHPGIYRYVE